MLTLVATPIGHLKDITLRALETLREADFVASEDTRKTGLLLQHFEIKKPQIAFHEHNEQRAGNRILALLEEGKSIAVVTDAGTPGICDPGYTLVRSAIAAGIEVTMAPGPAGLIMAVVLSGLPVHSFTFRGFPPRKSGARRHFFEVDARSPHTLIFYESPYRLDGFFADALAVYGDRPAALANDLTKKFELVVRGTLSSIAETAAKTTPKGEYIVVIGGCVDAPAPEDDDEDSELGTCARARKAEKKRQADAAMLAQRATFVGAIETDDPAGDEGNSSPLPQPGSRKAEARAGAAPTLAVAGGEG